LRGGHLGRHAKAPRSREISKKEKGASGDKGGREKKRRGRNQKERKAKNSFQGGN
jgi:hypothetical protein